MIFKYINEYGDLITSTTVLQLNQDKNYYGYGAKVDDLKLCLANFKALLSAFTWKHSPQGHEYWECLYRGAACKEHAEEARGIILKALAELTGAGYKKLSLEEARKEVI